MKSQPKLHPQLNLPLLDQTPIVIPAGKDEELVHALVELLLSAADKANPQEPARQEKTMNPKLTTERLNRRAIVYVRQSSPGQVLHNQESKRRQYGLVDRARELGFQNIIVIDDDLGRSGSGLVERPGFQRLVGEVCTGEVGAVFCIEASRLARNGRDWHHLIELCAWPAQLLSTPMAYTIRALSMIASCWA